MLLRKNSIVYQRSPRKLTDLDDSVLDDKKNLRDANKTLKFKLVLVCFAFVVLLAIGFINSLAKESEQIQPKMFKVAQNQNEDLSAVVQNQNLNRIESNDEKLAKLQRKTEQFRGKMRGGDFIAPGANEQKYGQFENSAWKEELKQIIMKDNLKNSNGEESELEIALKEELEKVTMKSLDEENAFSESDHPSEEELTAERSPRQRIAVAVTITNDSQTSYMDLLASVSQSVWDWQQTSIYDIDLIAFTRRGISKAVPYLRTFGFRIIERDLPVTEDELNPESKTYKRNAPKSGCCGLSELMKLYAYQMTDYYRVLHIDLDVLIVKNIDEIIGLPDSYELIYSNSTFDTELVSGGLLLVKPNPIAFMDIMDIIRQGDFRYDGSGWEGSGIGYTWGGETVQGVLPFYYLKKVQELRGKSNAALMLDRCKYNHQGSELCNQTKIEDISIIHMTLCQKPFRCLSMGHDRICKFQQNFWWNQTHRALDRLGIERNPRCDYWAQDKVTPKKYAPIDLNKHASLLL